MAPILSEIFAEVLLISQRISTGSKMAGTPNTGRSS
jgi:hypothetical protein